MRGLWGGGVGWWAGVWGPFGGWVVAVEGMNENEGCVGSGTLVTDQVTNTSPTFGILLSSDNWYV